MKVHILGGGTTFHIRPHLVLSAPAYGQTAWDLEYLLEQEYKQTAQVITHVTKMANGKSMNQDSLVIDTNADVAKFIDEVVLPDPEVKVLFMPVALCDFDVKALAGPVDPSEQRNLGNDYPRLKTDNFKGENLMLVLEPAEKIIKRIRKTRKDIFLVGFKTTTDAAPDEQFEAGLRLLKLTSCNLVLANDIKTRLNMVITPEQARYHVTTDRSKALEGLVEMTVARAADDFTRSTVVPGKPVPWDSPEIPDSLRTVVNHLIKRGAYRPFLGATVGHFAVKVGDGQFLTSIRKSNFNHIKDYGLVRVEAKGDDEVIAYGAKPSVGGQSQRIIFANHPGLDCIAHAHVQLKPGSKVPVRSQWLHECGSHSCGKNTSDGLKDFGLLKAVMLEKHGPNIVFSRDADPQKVIEFIEENFDLEHQTSELT